MNTLTVPVKINPALRVPADLENASILAVYDGFPDAQPWADEVMQRSVVCAHPRDAAQISLLTPLETGAPIGAFVEQSYRVARAVGVITKDTTASEGTGEEILGACVAQGLCSVTWREFDSNHFLVVQFSAPHAFGWGAGKSNLSHEYLKARCLQQFAHQARSLLEHIQDCGQATAVLTEFVGEWGPETEHIRRGLTTTCVLFWKASLPSAPAETTNESDALVFAAETEDEEALAC